MNTTNNSELIKSFEEAAQKRAVARRTISVLLLGAIFTFLLSLWNSGTTFVYEGIPQLSRHMEKQAAPIAEKYATKAGKMLNDLAPLYVTEIGGMLERELPYFERELRAQFAHLDSYAEKRWPDFEKALDQLVSEQQQVMFEVLSKSVGDRVQVTDLEEVADLYAVALENRLTNLVNTSMKEHIAVANEIGQNVYDIVDADYEVQTHIDPQEAVGLLFEMIGLQMQESLQAERERR